MKEIRNASMSAQPSLVSREDVRHERRDAKEHRQRILQVARNLFAQYGVHAVSMHQIAKAAGVGQGTLYRRYAHKGDLCMDLLREQHEQLRTNITTLFTTKADAPALERLDGLLSLSIAFLEEQGMLLNPVIFNEMRESLTCPEAEKKPDFQRYLLLHNLFADVLKEAVERKELAPLDVSFTAEAIISTLNPMLYHMQRHEHGYSPERILQGLRHIYIEGLRASSSNKS